MSAQTELNRMQIILEQLTNDCSGVSRMIEHKNQIFRPIGDQQFSHSLRSKLTPPNPNKASTGNRGVSDQK
jgi:hypothetical protein